MHDKEVHNINDMLKQVLFLIRIIEVFWALKNNFKLFLLLNQLHFGCCWQVFFWNLFMGGIYHFSRKNLNFFVLFVALLQKYLN